MWMNSRCMLTVNRKRWWAIMLFPYARNLQFSSLHNVIKHLGEQTYKVPISAVFIVTSINQEILLVMFAWKRIFQPENLHIISRENWWLEDEIRLLNMVPFHGLCLIFGGVGVSTFEKHQAVLFRGKMVGQNRVASSFLPARGTNISHRGKRKNYLQNVAFIGDMLVRKNSKQL